MATVIKKFSLHSQYEKINKNITILLIISYVYNAVNNVCTLYNVIKTKYNVHINDLNECSRFREISIECIAGIASNNNVFFVSANTCS